MSAKEAKSIVDTILETMADALASGHNVEIRGFGSFQVRGYDSYVGRNPKSGKEVQVAPKKLPFFKAGKELREQLNNNMALNETQPDTLPARLVSAFTS
jgi:integration host factor subunit beta